MTASKKSRKEKANPGRPTTYPDGAMFRVNVMLDALTVEKATALGCGNMSAGIRLAVKEHKA